MKEQNKSEPSADWAIVEPFDVDDESLAGLTSQECFALGVEWQMFRAKVESGRQFTDLILANNAGRLTKLAERAQRFVEARPANQGWVSITVGGYVV